MKLPALTMEELGTLPADEVAALEELVADALVIVEARIGQGRRTKLPPQVAHGADRHFREMNRLTKALEDGRITREAYDKRTLDAITGSFTDAYAKGKGVSPADLEPGDLEWIRRAAEHEAGFARKFGADIEAGELRMPRAERARMYGLTVEGVAWHGRVEAAGWGARIKWVLGQAEHCEDCLILAANGPYTKANLPTTPKAGDTACKCIVTPWSRVLTDRGQVPVSAVVVGDRVFTHRGRWRRVVAVHRNRPNPGHVFAWVVAPGGEIVGCTSDHRFLTPAGWADAISLAYGRLPMYTLRHEVQEVRGCGSGGCEATDVQAMQDGLPDLWWQEGPARGGVRFVRYASEGVVAVGGPCITGRDPRGDRQVGGNEAHQVRGSRAGVVQHAQGRWPGLRGVLGRIAQAVRLPIPVALGAGAWPAPAWCGAAPSERGLHGRPAGEPGGADSIGAWRGAFRWQREPEMEGRPAGEGLRDVRPGVPKVRSWAREAEAVLLERLQGREPVLYDLTVDEDESFVIEGIVAHNSRCKCHLEIVEGQLSAEERRAAAEYEDAKDASLSDLMEPPVAEGLRAPTAKEQQYIDGLRNRINYHRRRVAMLERDTPEWREAVRQRARYNAELIEFVDRESLAEAPIWSVDDVIDGRHLGRKAKRDILARGLDGASVDALLAARLESTLRWYESQVGEAFPELGAEDFAEASKGKARGPVAVPYRNRERGGSQTWNLLAEDLAGTARLLGRVLRAAGGMSVQVAPFDDATLARVGVWIDGPAAECGKILEAVGATVPKEG